MNNRQLEDFNEQEIQEFEKNNQQKKKENRKSQQNFENLEESFGDIKILEENQRAVSDQKKNFPYVQETKETQFQKQKISNNNNNTIQQTNAKKPQQFYKSMNPFLFSVNKNNIFESNSFSQDDNDHQIIVNIIEDLSNNLNNDNISHVMDKEVATEIQKRFSQNKNNDDLIQDVFQEQDNLEEKLQINSQLKKMDSSGLLYQNKNQFVDILPEAVEEEDQEEDVIYKLVQDKQQYSSLKKEEIFNQIKEKQIKQTKSLPKEDPRHQEANKDGGKECVNEKIRIALRNTGKKILSQIGRKILFGDFNLTTISFPIKCMIPLTALEKAHMSTCLFPFYMNKACLTEDPVERLKYVICATIGQFFINLSFLKPLNPILGETSQGSYPDGTKLYAEQISHHPPISYFFINGPENNYKYWGNYNYESNASINSLALKNRGSRHILFKNGQHISYNFAKEVYSGSFWGTMKVESLGKIEFKDLENQIESSIKFDDVSRKPTDYFKGKIKIKEKQISKILGSYMGFCDFDDKRYWDYQYVQPFKVQIEKSILGSDSQYRKDKILLERGHITMAQNAKVELEEIQRNDAKLRKNKLKKK